MRSYPACFHRHFHKFLPAVFQWSPSFSRPFWKNYNLRRSFVWRVIAYGSFSLFPCARLFLEIFFRLIQKGLFLFPQNHDPLPKKHLLERRMRNDLKKKMDWPYSMNTRVRYDCTKKKFPCREMQNKNSINYCAP